MDLLVVEICLPKHTYYDKKEKRKIGKRGEHEEKEKGKT